MPNTFFASDHHFGHANILNFVQHDGKPCRPFTTLENMHETMIENHNRVVRDQDTVYFLGDVAIPRKGLQFIARLNGKKRLVMGNHDVFVKNQNRDYFAAGFDQVSAFKKFDRFVCTHVPVHPDSLGRWGVNVHGHTHNNCMKLARGVDARTGAVVYSDKNDPRYFNVCVENINYTPISLEEINVRIA